MHIENLTEKNIESCIDLYIDVFSHEPWNDVYESRKQVEDFFCNYMADSYFLGFVLLDADVPVGLSIGAKKPYIKGMEYYIDQFCIARERQGQGLGSMFIKEIERIATEEGMRALYLSTEKGMPALDFYLKNGFKVLDELVFLAK